MNLLIINVNEKDNLEKWISEQANYHLVFLWYGELRNMTLQVERMPEVQCYFWKEYNGGKWKNIYRWILTVFKLYEPYFDRFTHFWFPDPDLEIPIDQINEFLKYANDNKIDLCQPSLSVDSRHSHPIHTNIPNSEKRKVDFAEIMCPCFSRQALGRMLWTFPLTYSGYGIDYVWGKTENCFVIDKFQVKHPDPPNFATRAKEMGFPNPSDEERETRERFVWQNK